MNREKALQWIEDIEEARGVGASHGGIDLSAWEGDFIDSLKEQLEEKDRLTERQAEKLCQIWERI